MSAPPEPLLNASRQIAIREAWLERHQEPILQPALPIVDPHHHMWDRADERYLLDDLMRDTASGHNIRATVFVQCNSRYDQDAPPERRSLGETRFIASIAQASAADLASPTRACAGIIGMVDLTLGDRVTPLLEAHAAIAGGRFRGVRNRTAWDPSPEVRSNLESPPPGPLANPAFHQGAARLVALGLTLDVWAYHPQLPQVLALARAVPALTIVVNHCGGPLGIGPFAGRRAEVFATWRLAMAALASCPNVVVKLGGLAMEVIGFDFHRQPEPPDSLALAAAWRPYVEACIEMFGAGRCMFESNFPVDKGMCSYAVLWNAFKRLAAGAGEAETAALFHGTATRVYRLQNARPL
ncbi:putative TIM-barrel fold metal-dependent hydrolase [Humitalea rosea]|uniref:Putative TIM-barrel fold metal-dependent hydrolase n=1 Tax=Humitalea rosea TaxID=990373 RepID=A0A2W7HXT9_9PROT|nr:amidohydrolase family protein [Humitalea rosea]PZW39294.1 putative TIM-barrel fold metal-dependent hydrolase [Humitalea rosea]